MKILITEPAPVIDRGRIQKYLSGDHTLYGPDDMVDAAQIDGLVIFGRRRIDQAYLAQFPAVRHIFRVGVGLDNVDLEYCKSQGITVQNRPGSNAVAVAELAVRGMLSIVRHGVHAHVACTSSQQVYERNNFLGHQLTSQHIGIIGMGHIGQKILERVVGFAPAGLYYYEPHHTFLTTLPLRQLESIEELLQVCDIVFLCVPLLPETYHLMDAERFAYCKKNLKLINTSRGGIIDEAMLYTFLTENPESGAYLDVREGDPAMTDSLKKLFTLPNVVFTPHMATESEEALDAMHYFEALA